MGEKLVTVAVIGGGPAGLMAAISASYKNARVTVFEHTAVCGKKILATGNGRCNYTNLYMDKECYNNNGEFAIKVIEQYDNNEVIAFFKKLGVIPKIKNDGVYPYSEQAVVIANALINEAVRCGVEIKTGKVVKKITPMADLEKGSNSFKLSLEDDTVFFDYVIIATGSKTYPKTGSDGSGYKLLEDLKVKLRPVSPALTALRSDNPVFKTLSGVRMDADIRLMDSDNKTILAKCRGELQLTDYGISGIPVFQISSGAVRRINKNGKVTCNIDFVPAMSAEELRDYINDRIEYNPSEKLYNLFSGLINTKITDNLTGRCQLRKDTCIGDLKVRDIDNLIDLYKNFYADFNDYNKYDFAQVCQGGVDVSEIDSATMESTKIKGLKFAGEVVDVDGICGGYNLQWAFSSGYVAGGSCI